MQRRQIFLEVLARTGSMAAAASAATPLGKAGRTSRHTFQKLVKDDPVFADEVAIAKTRALARVEETIVGRAIDGWERPIYQMGKLVGTERCYDHKLLLAAAQALAPERWAAREKVEIEGQIGLVAVPMAPASAGEWSEKHRVIDQAK